MFFGRSAHVDELLGELARSRFVAVMGASASGKSSLVNAGLLPALLGGFSPRVGSHWRIAAFRPGVNPIHNLARALAAPEVLATDDADPVNAAAQVEATLRRSGFGLADAVREGGALDGGRVLVVVDQFEELFRFHANGAEQTIGSDASPFAQLLIEATQDDEAPVDVVVTMRSDFLGDCSQLRELPEAINQGLYLVPRLTRTQLQEAITAPAAVGGGTLSPRLVQRVLNDAGTDPDMLPVVQHALMRTWDTWAGETGGEGPIDLEHYESCGGVDDALSRHADEAYFELQGDRRRAVAELMFKRITELGDDHREVRRPTPLAEIADVARASPEEVEACIGHFAEPGRSFVTVSTDGVVDISHESLIRQWPRLKQWVREEADSRDVYRRLANAAERWERGEAALLRDPELEIASRWWTDTRPNQAWADRYHPAFEPAARYLERSQKAARRRRARAFAGVSALAVLALVAVLLAGWANRQKNKADEQRRTAIARQLAASSAEAGAASRSVSILSAIEALHVSKQDGPGLPVTEEALRQAMKAPVGLKLASGPAVRGHAVTTAFSPDGTVVATGGQDGKVRLWPVDSSPDPEPRVLSSGTTAPISALAISSDGTWLAAGRDDGVLVLWDLTTPGAPAQELQRHALGITTMAFSPDGRRLATGSLDSTALLWDLADPSDPTPLPGHKSFVLSLAFSADGRKLVTGGNDRVARVWTVDDIAAGPTTLRGHDDGVRAVAFSPDGQSVATGGEDGRAGVWDLARPTQPRFFLPHRGAVSAVAFSADGRLLATGSKDDAARLWNLRDPDPAASPIVLQHDDDVEAVAFSSARPEQGNSSHWLVTGSRDSTARRYNLDDLYADPLVWGGHEGTVASVAFSAGDRWVVTGSDDGTARLWSLEHPSIQPAVLDHGVDASGATVGVEAIAFSSDGSRLATGTSDKIVRLWDLDDLGAAPKVLHHEVVEGYEDAGITALAFSPDGHWLATGSGDRIVRMWNLREPSADPTDVPDFDAMVTALAFSPDSRHLAVGVDTTAFLVDTNDLTAAPTPLTAHEDEVTSVAFSADGTQLATGSRDGTVALWDTRHLSAAPKVLPGDEAVTSLAWRPTGGQLATGVDSTVQLWDPATTGSSPAAELQTGATVTSVGYSPDGHTLLVAAGATVQLWDVGARDPANSKANPVVLRDHAGTVNAVAYSPDGGHFASAGDDGTVRVWLPLDALVELACRTVGHNLSEKQWQLLLPGSAYHRTCEQWPAGT